MSADPLEWLVGLEGVPSGFAGARDGIDAVLRDRGLRRTSPETTAESLLRGAHASGVLEGSASELAEVREGRGDGIAADAVRVSTELLSLVPVVRRTPLQALARLHAVAGRGSLPEERLGRPRDAESAERLRAIAILFTTETEAPALAVAAVVHAELMAATPFGSHNGIVARAAERLVLAARGVDEKSLVVPEAAHLALRPQYESNLRGYAIGGTPGMHSWLLYATEAYAAAADASPLRSAAD
ncbi:hypothetical protein KUV85_12420 [Nocardioides panacisoli]|uniref:hypothetical protein n=1 Tax=Nocardioides panacisoli TaxID=627624 RepID=UPI001C632130|nr:hypothetical protein [Nocardioides panacisoli]QYJ03136.1 hypothetical protein KUV85_12420 [Nocardioides panacisoli]